MRILILANNSIGLYDFRKDLIKKMIADGNEVFASVPFEEKIELLKELNCNLIDTSVDRRGINPITDLGLIINYFKIVRTVKPDIIITYTIKPNIYGGLVAMTTKTPYFANITGLGTAFWNDNWLKKLSVFLYKSALKNVKKVFFENCENRDVFIKNKIIPFEKTYLLNGAGVNINDFSFTEYPKDGEISFLFIGRVMKEKGIEEYLSAAKRIKEKYDNVYFDIVGPMEDNYKGYIEELNNAGIVNYYGLQMDVRPFIEKSGCFVLPSYHEGMANTLLESGAMGRPLITSNIHGCLEAVLENVNGFLCNVGDEEALYQRIEEFISLPYEKRREMGENSHKYIIDKFDKKKVVEKTTEVLYFE